MLQYDIYLLNNKEEAIEAFNQYKNEVKTQLNKKIKMIKSEGQKI